MTRLALTAAAAASLRCQGTAKGAGQMTRAPIGSPTRRTRDARRPQPKGRPKARSWGRARPRGEWASTRRPQSAALRMMAVLGRILGRSATRRGGGQTCAWETAKSCKAKTPPRSARPLQAPPQTQLWTRQRARDRSVDQRRRKRRRHRCLLGPRWRRGRLWGGAEWGRTSQATRKATPQLSSLAIRGTRGTRGLWLPGPWLPGPPAAATATAANSPSPSIFARKVSSCVEEKPMGPIPASPPRRPRPPLDALQAMSTPKKPRRKSRD